MAPDVAVGIVGLGYWGPNLLRNFRALKTCRVAAVADLDPTRLAAQARLYPDVRQVTDVAELIEDDSIDALVLALPAAAMPDLAVEALKRGKHVMVEKPMAPSLQDGRRMLGIAEGSDRVAMVDLTFVYSPAVRHLRQLMQGARLGRLHYMQSTRINLGRFQPDVDVIWDLVVHDVSILKHVLGRDPTAVLATGRGLKSRVDTAHVTLWYEDGIQAFIHVSWMAPMKVRMSLLACERGLVLYDDVQPDEKLRIYEVQGEFDPYKEDAIVPTFRLGDVTIPRLPQEEPLRMVAQTFVDAIRHDTKPTTDWSFGVAVLEVLEAARHSLESGQTVRVGTDGR